MHVSQDSATRCLAGTIMCLCWAMSSDGVVSGHCCIFLVSYECDHELVWQQLALLHLLLGDEAQLRLGLDLRTQDVA